MQTIESVRRLVVPIVRQYGVKKAAVFGSVAKGNAHEDSDVDLLIDRGTLRSLWQFAGMVDDLEKALGVHVDVLTYDQLQDAFMGAPIGREVVIYEEE
ncbi:MAG: nucleotidyltransferase domain-containing protein [Gracilibacteraceae bacterium]|jgi:predicted nucleotidyltransferase|nr:nucleotidyltransferase domain-containing protein [Gracilibacteraceae bacterium]